MNKFEKKAMAKRAYKALVKMAKGPNGPIPWDAPKIRESFQI